MSKVILLRRNGNAGDYAEGNEGTVIEDSYFQVTDALFDSFQGNSRVESRWTIRQIVPDGTSPDYKDADGPDRLLSDVTESNNAQSRERVDATEEFTASDYGYEDDFATDLP